MTTELGLTTILIGVLLTIHGAYFVVVRKMGHLGSLSAMIAFIGGCLMWCIMFLLASGADTQINIDLPVATIDIVGKDIFTNMHLFIRESLEINNSGGTPDSAAQIVAPAFVEEIGKLLFLYLTYITINHLRTRERIENIGTSLGAIGIVALGFATAENIQYLFQIGESTDGVDVALVSIMTRSILLPLVHMSFALYMGYAFGKSTYMRWDMIDARKIRKLRYLFKDRRKKWRFTTLKALFIIVGIILAGSMHTIYNFFLLQGGGTIAILFALVLICFFFYMLINLEKHQDYQSIWEKIKREKHIKKLRQQRV